MWVSHTPLYSSVSSFITIYSSSAPLSLPHPDIFPVDVSSVWQSFPLTCSGRDISFQHVFNLWHFYVLGASPFKLFFPRTEYFYRECCFYVLLGKTKVRMLFYGHEIDQRPFISLWHAECCVGSVDTNSPLHLEGCCWRIWVGEMGYLLFTLGRDLMFLPRRKELSLIAFWVLTSLSFSGTLLFTMRNLVTEREKSVCVCVQWGLEEGEKEKRPGYAPIW